MTLPPFFEPQLATLVESAPQGPDWAHELKYDGYRILARLERGEVSLLSRRGNDWTGKFPTIRAAVAKLPAKSAILDGEVAVPLTDGRTSFQALQRYLGTVGYRRVRGGGKGKGKAAVHPVPAEPAAEGEEQEAGSPIYYVFDLLFLDGKDLRALPLEKRKAALATLCGTAPRGLPLAYSDHVVGQGQAFLEAVRGKGLEGMVSKRLGAPYRSGRHDDWRKSKCFERQEFVVGGFTDPGGSRGGFGALLLGTYDEGGRLQFAGSVGTGFDHKTLVDLRKRLDARAQQTCPFDPPPPRAWLTGEHWVRPDLVVEVAFAEWTGDGRLRHPSYQGLRLDKKARDVVRELPADSDIAEDPPPTAPARRAAVAAGSKEPRLTHPERVYYPKLGFTKRMLAAYYEAVGSAMLPHVHGRPLSLVRCPEGVEGETFYMKHWPTHTPAALRRIPITEGRKQGQYLVLEDVAGFVSFAQIGALEVHTWNSVAEHLDYPNRFVLDLDPGPEVAFSEVITTALLIRDMLAGLGLTSFVKTTGGKGLHVVAPLRPELDWPSCLKFSQAVAQLVVGQRPRFYTTALPKAGREKKIFIDYLRNHRGATSIACFSTRARPEATVSVPLAWEELGPDLRPDAFTVLTVPERLRKMPDPWSGYWTCDQGVRADLAELARSESE